MRPVSPGTGRTGGAGGSPSTPRSTGVAGVVALRQSHELLGLAEAEKGRVVSRGSGPVRRSQGPDTRELAG